MGGVTTYNIWDGWNLLVRYDASNNWIEAYDIGAGGLIEDDMNGYYYHDASGSTSHLADNTGHLLEWYRYDLQGTPVFYNFANTQQSASAYGIRHLFTGQQWYSELGLYDLRNRFYSPDIGRFLQPDPIGFRGDRTNLYRYCRNNPVGRRDSFGLFDNTRLDGSGAPGGIAEVERVWVNGESPNTFWREPGGFGGAGGSVGGGEPGGRERVTYERVTPEK